ncbi:MAG: ARMT1-like domain-containing protein [Atribacterota bacterium]
MKAQVECFSCNIRQAQEAAAVVCPEKDFLWRVSQRICMQYADADPNWTPAYMTSLAHKVAREMTGVDDIYYRHKKHYNRLALKLYPELKGFVGDGEGALERAVRVAIVGNIIDLGVYREVEVSQILEQLYTVQWGLYDFAQFEQDVRKAKTIVYVGDNAGEIVFDKILLEELKKVGIQEIFFVVKGGPISNDALLADFWEVGLDNFAQVLTTGKDECGIVPEEGPSDLQEVWKRADLVISKGQGNFESLSGRKETIYFLLKAKCVPVAREFGVKQGALILKKNHVSTS